MAEIKFNQAYENLTDTQKREFDGVLGMGGFNERYQTDPMAARVTSDPDYATFAPISKAYGESKTINDGFDWGSLVGMSSADASEMPQKYGLQTNTMGGVTLNADGTLNYNNTQTPNLGFRSMVDMAADTNNFMDQFQTPQAANRYSGMGQVGPVKSDMIGNTISEAMIDEERIPGRVQESVPNYQNWFERMMSGAQDKLGGAWGKTKELGSRFKEKAGPVFGLASMIGNATNPLNPDSYNYNPELSGELNYLNTQPNMLVDNATSGLLQYGPDSVLSGKNVMSLLGSNSYNEALNNKVGWFKDRLAKGKTISLASYNKAKAEKKAHQNRIQDRLNKENAAAAVNAARQVKMEQARKGGQNPSAGTFSRHSPGGISQQTSRDARGGMSGWGLARGGRVRFSDGGLATLFTRRG